MISSNAILLTDEDMDLSHLGIASLPLNKAMPSLTQTLPSVLGVHLTPRNSASVIQQLTPFLETSGNTQWILFHQGLSTPTLIEVFNTFHPALTMPYSPKAPFEQAFSECFRLYLQAEQNQQLIDMVQDKNEELKKLTIELEKKITQRQLDLEKSRIENIQVQKKLKVLEKIMVQIYDSTSINEIEHGVTALLKKEFQVKFVQIRRPSQTNLSKNLEGLRSFKKTLKSGAHDFGHIIFYKDKSTNFDSGEKKFFNQVAEVVSLAIERTFQYLKSQELKKQWEATFDAILDPICLTDQNYNILRANARFAEKMSLKSPQAAIGQKCFQVLFDRSSPCQGCLRGQIFQIRNPSQKSNSEIFDVYSNNLGAPGRDLFFHMYKDVTQDLNLQRQVIESAKMAELGTISSSIAHELNNPIGGMLNFIQLMKMDLDGNEDFYPDILEIEKGIIKCKNIVKNLLGFVRKSFNDEVSETILAEVIEQAIKITELKTRSLGIKITFENQAPEAKVNGRFNLLTHAIRNVLQNSQESLIAKRLADKGFQGSILISLKEDSKCIELSITDNGDGIPLPIRSKIFDPLFTTKDPETNSGLGLTLALQIVKEHKGSISVSSDKDKNLSVKMVFFKAEVQSGPSEF